MTKAPINEFWHVEKPLHWTLLLLLVYRWCFPLVDDQMRRLFAKKATCVLRFRCIMTDREAVMLEQSAAESLRRTDWWSFVRKKKGNTVTVAAGRDPSDICEESKMSAWELDEWVDNRKDTNIWLHLSDFTGAENTFIYSKLWNGSLHLFTSVSIYFHYFL